MRGAEVLTLFKSAQAHAYDFAHCLLPGNAIHNRRIVLRKHCLGETIAPFAPPSRHEDRSLKQ
jgi:hypothetical protein